MATAKPIVSTNIGEIPFILKDKVNALIKKPNYLDVAKGIDQLICDPKLSKKLAHNALKLVEANYTYENVAMQTVNTYQRILHDS